MMRYWFFRQDHASIFQNAQMNVKPSKRIHQQQQQRYMHENGKRKPCLLKIARYRDR